MRVSIPVVVEPIVVQVPIAGVAVQIGDVPLAAVHGERAHPHVHTGNHPAPLHACHGVEFYVRPLAYQFPIPSFYVRTKRSALWPNVSSHIPTKRIHPDFDRLTP